MTDKFTQDPTLDYASPFPQPTAARGRTIIVLCWLVILAIVGLEVVANIDRGRGAADNTADNATMTAIGHCIVGAHVLAVEAEKSAAKSAQPDPVAPLVEQMMTVAKTPADQMRVAIVAKEVGLPSVDTMLSTLSASTKPPATVRRDLGILQIIYHAGPAALSPSQRQTLVEDEGWFGRVALSYGLTDSDGGRSAVLAEARRAFVASGIAAAVGGGALLVGVCLIVLAIILSATGRLPLMFRRGSPDSVFLEAFAVYLSGFVLLSLMLHFVFKASGLGWSFLLTIMLPIAAGWPVLRGKPWLQTRMELGWHRGNGFVREIACGIGGYIAALPLLLMMLLITLALMRLSGSTPSHPIQNYLGGGPWDLVMVYLLACVWAPIFEETMFRGALFNHLRSRHGWWMSAGAVGLLFAAIHPQGWTAIPILGGIGMVLCGLREWRGSLIASMAAHATNNAVALTVAILLSR